MTSIQSETYEPLNVVEPIPFPALAEFHPGERIVCVGFTELNVYA